MLTFGIILSTIVMAVTITLDPEGMVGVVGVLGSLTVWVLCVFGKMVWMATTIVGHFSRSKLPASPAEK